MPALDMTEALRSSELFALRWRSFDDENILVLTETVYRAKLHPYGKTPGAPPRSTCPMALPTNSGSSLSERVRRLPSCQQLPLSGPEASGGRPGTGKAELPDPAPDDGDSGSEDGVGEGHPGTPAALASRHVGARVHAGVAGELAANGRGGVPDIDERRRGKEASGQMPQNADNAFEMTLVSG